MVSKRTSLSKRWSGAQVLRLKDKENRLERRLSKMWHQLNTLGGTDKRGYPCVLDHMLWGEKPRYGATSDRDRKVASTVIQWLGTSDGEPWIREALREHEALSHLDKEDMALLRELTEIKGLEGEKVAHLRTIIMKAHSSVSRREELKKKLRMRRWST